MIENKNFEWYIHLPFLSEAQCDELLTQIKNEGGWVRADVINPNKNNEVSFSKYRELDELYLNEEKNKDIKNNYDWVLKRLDTIVRLTNNKVWNFNIEKASGDFRVLKYNIGNQFKWHSGTDKGFLSLNKITCLIQLSDPKILRVVIYILHFKMTKKNFLSVHTKKDIYLCFHLLQTIWFLN